MVEQGAIEIVHADTLPRRIRAVLFDWDGTLSLLREGWADIMCRQMLGILEDSGSRQSSNDRQAAVESIVVGLNGRPSIVQMQAFAELVQEFSGQTIDPVGCLGDYRDRLAELARERYRAIEFGAVAPDAWAVPGARALLESLRATYPIVVLSGTPLDHVRCEAELLRLSPLVNDWRAPNGDDPAFNKAQVIDGLLAEHGIDGSQLLGFGDGVVETQEIKRVGGVAVAVASHEPPRRGVNPAKRVQLIRAGADAIIGDFEQFANWLPSLISRE
jgi:phosphoglycolate phosphatase-like HAD superfamily hydrolase